jgi:hypothetical protein
VSSSGGYRYLSGEDIRDEETRGRKRKLDDIVINKIIHEIESQPVGEVSEGISITIGRAWWARKAHGQTIATTDKPFYSS